MQRIQSPEELRPYLGQIVRFKYARHEEHWQYAKLRTDSTTLEQNPPYVNGNLPTRASGDGHIVHDHVRFTTFFFNRGGAVVPLTTTEVGAAELEKVRWSYEGC